MDNVARHNPIVKTKFLPAFYNDMPVGERYKKWICLSDFQYSKNTWLRTRSRNQSNLYAKRFYQSLPYFPQIKYLGLLILLLQLVNIILPPAQTASIPIPANYRQFSPKSPVGDSPLPLNPWNSTTAETFSPSNDTKKLDAATALNFELPTNIKFPSEPRSTASKNDYNSDCSDQRYKEIRCQVNSVDCSVSTEFTLKNETESPGQAHDIRFEPYAKALSQGRKSNGARHRLTVDMSWQTPPNNSTKLLIAFLVEILEESGPENPTCFLFNISESNWTSDTISNSPRLHFLTSGIFQFSKAYSVTVKSLPYLSRRPSIVHERFTTPNNPHIENHNPSPNSVDATANVNLDKLNISSEYNKFPMLSPNCTKFSHEFASQWTAGFRRIVLHSLARTMQVEFVGAPPQYCFEQYEIRLLDETATELLHSGFVSVGEMKTEFIDNTTIFFGEYNFTNLELDRSYIPSLIPVERAQDGRCLCPVNSVDPYDNKVICSCVAADWKPIRLSRFDIVENDCQNCTSNSTIIPPIFSERNDPNYWPYFLILNLIALLLLICMAYFVMTSYRNNGKLSRVRFVKNPSAEGNNFLREQYGHIHTKPPNGLYFEPTDSACQTPLIVPIASKMGYGEDAAMLTSVLLVYSHDSPEHEAAVLAFAEFLRDVFGLQVGLDKWDEETIERNTIDYLSASVINADKVIIINSIGALHRFHCKITSLMSESAPETKKFVVERNSAERFDHLFLAQIDMALQHHCIISIRFTGTPTADVLPILGGRLQYVVPDNLTPLMTAILGYNVKNDPRLNHPLSSRLSEAVRSLAAKSCADPDWFVNTHHRRPVSANAPVTVTISKSEIASEATLPLPVISVPEIAPIGVPTIQEKEPELPVDQKYVPSENSAAIQIKPSVPDTVVSYDSGIVATTELASTAIDVPDLAYCSISIPSVTVIPASPLPTSPPMRKQEVREQFEVLHSEPTGESTRNATDSSSTLSSASQEEEGVYTVADSGILTDTFDQNTISQSHNIRQLIKGDENLSFGRQKLPPTTSIMITNRNELMKSSNNNKKNTNDLEMKIMNGMTDLNGNGTITKNGMDAIQFDENQNLLNGDKKINVNAAVPPNGKRRRNKKAQAKKSNKLRLEENLIDSKGCIQNDNGDSGLVTDTDLRNVVSSS